MPDFGTLAVEAVEAPAVERFATEPVVITDATLLQVVCEIGVAGQLAVLPPALHPTSPPIAIWQLLRVDESPWGAFRLASIRVGARAATKSRSFLVHAFVDNPDAGAALRESWGFPCVEAEVGLRVGHDRIAGWADVHGVTPFDVELADPAPIASGSVYYAPSMNLARTPLGTRLLQVDPEYLVKTVARGRPQVRHHPGFVDDLLAPTWPISATSATVDITLPVIRYVCDPGLPAAQGTEQVPPPHAGPGVPYLTQEWLDMSTAVMEPMPPCPGATFVMQCVMTEAPGGGEVVFHRVFEDGRLLRSVLAGHEAPDVVLYSTYDDSILHLTGGLPEKEAFRSGRIRPEGDVELLRTLTPLSRSAEYLAAVDEIARRTNFSAPTRPA